MKVQSLCILGGTGFVGHQVVSQLASGGRRIKVLTRHRERHRDLLVVPAVDVVEADVHDSAVLREHFRDCDAVIHLVGILNEKGRDGRGFRAAHVELPRKIVQACRETGVRRILHMSALHADAAKGPSHYLRTKGEGEDLVHAAAAEGLLVTSFRPSVIFGPKDNFINRFAGLLRFAPFFFPLACPDARFAPVYVGDVARAFAVALEDPRSFGRRYDLCGPRVYTLKEIVELTARAFGLRRRIIGLNDTLSRLQARLLEFVPGKPFSMDNYLSLQVDSVCRDGNGLQQLGITPTALEAIVPRYAARRLTRPRYHDRTSLPV